MIASAQRVEHYEIAVYAHARHMVRKGLGREDDLKDLLESLQQEKHSDEVLSALAKQVGSIQRRSGCESSKRFFSQHDPAKRIHRDRTAPEGHAGCSPLPAARKTAARSHARPSPP